MAEATADLRKSIAAEAIAARRLGLDLTGSSSVCLPGAYQLQARCLEARDGVTLPPLNYVIVFIARRPVPT